METGEHIGPIVKANMNGVEKFLQGEKVIDAVSGFLSLYQKGIMHQKEEIFAVVLTQSRVILYHKKMLGHSLINVPLSKITDINFNVGVVYTDLKISAGDDIIAVRKVGKSLAQRFLKNLKLLIPSVNIRNITIESPQAPSTSQAPNIDIADQIKKLADLKAQGLLTEEEFTAQKKKLLSL